MAKYAVLWWSISFQFKWVYFQRGDKCHAAIKRLGSISIIEEKKWMTTGILMSTGSKWYILKFIFHSS